MGLRDRAYGADDAAAAEHGAARQIAANEAERAQAADEQRLRDVLQRYLPTWADKLSTTIDNLTMKYMPATRVTVRPWNGGYGQDEEQYVPTRVVGRFDAEGIAFSAVVMGSAANDRSAFHDARYDSDFVVTVRLAGANSGVIETLADLGAALRRAGK